MGKVKAIQHRDKEEIGFTEPYPAIQFTGSYNDIIDIVGLIGIENLDFPKEDVKYWNEHGKFSDEILRKYCTRDSVFSLPGKINEDIYPPLRMVIRPRDWVIIKADLKNNFYVDVIAHEHFLSNYEIIDYHKNIKNEDKERK